MRTRHFERATCIPVLAALALYYGHFFMTPWQIFSFDANDHAKYIEMLAETHTIPRAGDTSATRHPVTYYALGAALYDIAQWAHEDPIKVVRHLSVAFFMVFICCNIEMLRLFFPKPVAGYYAALGLLLFWPVGVTIASRLSCDVMLYAAQSAVLLALAYWFRKHTIHAFSWAFIAAGVAILAKNAGIAMLVLVGAVWLQQIWEARHADWRRFMSPEVLLSIAFAYSSYLLTQEHHWVNDIPAYQVTPRDTVFWVKSLISFDPLLWLKDTSVGDSQGMFWNVFIHSLLIGDILPWRLMNSLMVFNLCWMVMVCYMLWGLRGAASVMSPSGKRLAQAFMLYIVISLAGMIHMMIKTGNLYYADARYIYPLVGIIALTFGWIIERHRARGNARQYFMGKALAGVFVSLTFLLFAAQWVLER